MGFCLICDNTGEVCDICGESDAACECPRFRDDNVDPDTPLATFSPCPECGDETKSDEDYISEDHIKKFRKIARDMAKLLEEIRKTCPKANMYLEDSGNWNLMTGESHDESSHKSVARQDRAVAMEIVPHSGGGAW